MAVTRNDHYIAAECILAKVKDVHPSMVPAYLAEAHIHALLAQVPDEPLPIPAQRSGSGSSLQATK